MISAEESGSEEEDDQGEASGILGENVYRKNHANILSREEREKLKRLRNAFVNYKPLDNMVSTIMIKYGLRLR
jgi:hypothetical protein